MQTQHAACPVRSVCRGLEVSRSGSYEWRGRSPRTHTATAQHVQEAIQRYVTQGRGTYGTRRMKPLLGQEGLPVRRRRSGRWLAQAGLHCKTRRQFQAPLASGQAATVAPHRLPREFTGHAPDPVYVGDSTDLPPGAGGRYRAVILELCARAVVGWAMAPHRRAELGTQALSMALCQRQLAAGLRRPTDRGIQ